MVASLRTFVRSKDFSAYASKSAASLFLQKLWPKMALPPYFQTILRPWLQVDGQTWTPSKSSIIMGLHYQCNGRAKGGQFMVTFIKYVYKTFSRWVCNQTEVFEDNCLGMTTTLRAKSNVSQGSSIFCMFFEVSNIQLHPKQIHTKIILRLVLQSHNMARFSNLRWLIVLDCLFFLLSSFSKPYSHPKASTFLQIVTCVAIQKTSKVLIVILGCS